MTSKGVTTQGQALPISFEELRGMADAFVKSGMFEDTKQLSQAIVKMQAGRELGLAPVFSMQNINMIRGRLTCSANTLAMLVKKSGIYDYRIKEHTDQSCTIVFYQRETDKWVEVGESAFTMKDAERAKLVKADGGWEKFPRAMLFSRAISQGARLYAPDAIGGVYTDEEIRSIPPKVADELPDTVPEPLPETLEPQIKADENEIGDNVLIDTSWDAIRPNLTQLYQKKEGWITIKQILDKLEELGADISSGKIQTSYECLDEANKLKFVWMMNEARKGDKT